MKSPTTFFLCVFGLVFVAAVVLEQSSDSAFAQDPFVQSNDNPFGDGGDEPADDPFADDESKDEDPFGGSNDDADPFGGQDEFADDPFEDSKQVDSASDPVRQAKQTPHIAAAIRIEKELLKKTNCDFDETPLADAVEIIGDEHRGIPVVVDAAALDLAGISASDATVTTSLSGVSLRSALRLMLKSLDLTYIVKDEVLLITTIEEAEQQLKTEIYPVVDLICGDSSETVARSVDMLTDLVVTTVSPESWEEVGGTGSLSCYRGQMVVAQTGEVHERVVELLAKLRKSIKQHGGLDLPLPSLKYGKGRESGGGGFGSGGGGNAEGGDGGGGGVF